MATIIKNRSVVSDNWQLLKADAGSPEVPPAGDVIVPLAVWLERRSALLARNGKTGVWLDGAEDPAAIAGDLASLGVIAIHFKHFTDGRGCSIARLLRERYGWTGELRAIGHVIRDVVFYFSRCGFDAFDLLAGEDAQAALSAFGDFSEAYQTSVERPQPLFRRRTGAAQTAAAK